MYSKNLRAVYLLSIAAILFLNACGPEVLIQVGEPAVSCANEGHALISIPVSESIHGRESVYLSYDGDIYHTDWASSNADFIVPVSPGGGEEHIGLHVDVIVDSAGLLTEKEDFDWTIDIPNCTIYSFVPPENPSENYYRSIRPEGSLSNPSGVDGIAEIDKIGCWYDDTMIIFFKFPEAVGGKVVGRYELSVDGETIGIVGGPGWGLYTSPFPVPDNASFLHIVLKSLPNGDTVLETDAYQAPNCHDYAGIPTIYNSTCLQGAQLMVVFEFPRPVTGQYEALIDGQAYQYTPVADYPNRAYFFGPPPEYQGSVSVSLSTIPDGTIVFEQQEYAFPACGVQRPKRDNGGGGEGPYVPPSY